MRKHKCLHGIALRRKLIELDAVPFEQWANSGVPLSSVSSNSKVQSGITTSGIYFSRKWSKNFESSRLVVEGFEDEQL